MPHAKGQIAIVEVGAACVGGQGRRIGIQPYLGIEDLAQQVGPICLAGRDPVSERQANRAFPAAELNPGIIQSKRQAADLDHCGLGRVVNTFRRFQREAELDLKRVFFAHIRKGTRHLPPRIVRRGLIGAAQSELRA